MAAVPARKATPAIGANSSVHRTVLDRTVPRFANARTAVNVIRFPASASAHPVSQGRYVLNDVQRVSTESSVGRIVAARMGEAAIHRRVSVFVRLVIPDRYVLIAARANGMAYGANKSVSASTERIVITRQESVCAHLDLWVPNVWTRALATHMAITVQRRVVV